MLGADWLQFHKCLWDFGSGQLHIDGQPAVTLSRRHSLRCGRVYIQQDSMIRSTNTTTEAQLPSEDNRRRSHDQVAVVKERRCQPVATRGFKRTVKEGEVRSSMLHAYKQHADMQLAANNHGIGVTSPVSIANVVSMLTSKLPVNRRTLHQQPEVASVLAGEHLHAAQYQDPDIGPVLRLRMQHAAAAAPNIQLLLPYSEATKLIWSQWQQLELCGGVLYRRRQRQGRQADT